jgi:hypothetical protein
LKVSKNFIAQEFISKKHYDYLIKRYGNSDAFLNAFYRYIDYDTVILAQNVRDFLETSIIINDWYYGGNFQNRGFRTPDFYDTDNKFKLSQHQRGLAIDFHSNTYTPDEIRDKIMPAYKELGFWRVEMDVNWVHIDRCKGISDELVKFYP